MANVALVLWPVAGSVAVMRKAPRVSADDEMVLPDTVGTAPNEG